jgi:hypothetical protein
MKRALLIFVASVFLIACKSSKYRKIAGEFEKNGAFEQAANYYYKSLLKKPANVTSIIGYKKNSQIVLDQLFSKFENSFKNKDYKATVYFYTKAQKNIKQASSFNITLHEPQNAAVYFNESKVLYLEQLYAKGVQEIQVHNYANAKVVFKEIVALDGQFKDAKNQLTIAECEPLYLEGIKMLEQNANKKAYYKFTDVLQIATYKDVLELKEEAQDKAMIKIAVGILPSKRFQIQYNPKYRNYLLGKLQDISSPFYSYIEFNPRINTSLQSQLADAKSHGAKALVMLDIDHMSQYTGRMKIKNGTAYKSVKQKYKDDEGNTKEKKVYVKEKYKIYEQSRNTSSHVSFKMYSTLSGAVMVQYNATEAANDAIKYGLYTGNSKVLIPGYWKYQYKKDSSDKVNASSYSAKRNLTNLFHSRKILNNTSDLFFQTLDNSGSKINNKILAYEIK